MGSGGIRVIRAIPGATSLGPILSDFGKRDGIVTAFSENFLRVCRENLPETAIAEIESFASVVRRMLNLSGEIALPSPTSGQTEAAIAYACREVGSGSPFGAASRFAGTHKALAQTLDELSEWGLARDELRRLTPSCSPDLAVKLTWLCEVLRQLDQIISALSRQSLDTQMRACLDALPETDGEVPRLLVFAGSNSDPLKLRWLKWASDSGADITVVLDRHATEELLFKDSLIANEILGGATVDLGSGNKLLNDLFAQGSHGGSPVEIVISSAADPLAEAEWALRGCLQANGVGEPAVYARDLQSYAPLIESAAKRLEVPIRMFQRAPLLTNAYARLTLAAMKACASQDVRMLFPIFRSSYLGVGVSVRDRLIAAAKDAHRSGSQQWQKLEAWAAPRAEEFPWLIALLDWRRRSVGASLPLRDWLLLVSELVQADARYPWSTVERHGSPALCDRDVRARNQMERLLVDHAYVESVTGGRPQTFASFVEFCANTWQHADVSIPSSESGVRVSSDPATVAGADTVYVLGMLEGVFPRRRSEDPILSDAEREEISDLRYGQPRLRTSFETAEAERDEFYRVCAAAGSKLVFSYPEADDQRDNIPAFYLQEVKRAAGDGNWSEERHPRPFLAPNASDCVSTNDSLLREALNAERTEPETVSIGTDVARSLVGAKEFEKHTPDEIRDAYECPFQHAMRHRLKLFAGRRRARWAMLRGLPESAGLRSATTPAQATASLEAALEAELEQLVPDIPKWELQLLRSGGRRLIREWVGREFRAREIWPKQNVRLNIPFGGDGLQDTLPGNVRLTGSTPSLSNLGRYTVAQLFGPRAPQDNELGDPEKLYYGLYLLAMYDRDREAALEIESTVGRRTLMVMSRVPGTPLRADVTQGLFVVDLATSEDPFASRKQFHNDVKGLLRLAIQRMRSADIEPRPGEHCSRCEYGELCRRSKEYSDEDSPFGKDLVLEDA